MSVPGGGLGLTGSSRLSIGFALLCVPLGIRGVAVGGDQLAGGVACLLAAPLLLLGVVLRERALRRLRAERDRRG